MITHIIRALVIRIANIFSGMHFFKLKRVLLNIAPGINIGKGTRIVGPFWAGTVSKIYIGKDTFINRQFNVEGNGNLWIGDKVDFGPNVRILTGGHEIGEEDHRAAEGIVYTIRIEDGCWIGANTVVLGNTTIGKGAVVGAATVVIRNIPQNVLCVGHPAEVKRIL